MQAFLRSHRWVILTAGAAIQILTGVPAAWGVFQRAVCEEYALDAQRASLIFSWVICAFGIGCVLGGLLQDKKGPRVAGLVGTVSLAAGFVAGAFVPAQNAWLFYTLFSLPVGLGCALLYPAVMSCAQRWYADKKGFATGIIGGAVGLSGAVLTLAGRFLINGWGVRTAFWVLGAAMAVVCGAACIVLENPSEGSEAQTKNGAQKQGAASGAANQKGQQETQVHCANDSAGVTACKSGKRDGKSDANGCKQAKGVSAAKSDDAVDNGGHTKSGFTGKQDETGAHASKRPSKYRKTSDKAPGTQVYTIPQMLKTRQYWLLTAAVCFATPAMLLFSPIIVEFGTQRGLPETAALSCVAVGAVFSAAGRLIMPWCSDKIGRRAADLILFALLCAASGAFWVAQSWWVLAVYCVLAFAYSGEAALIPATVTDLFGQKNTGVHYGLAALGMSVGSLAFPLLAGVWDSITPRHIIAIAATAAGFVCVWLLKPTVGKRL